MRWKTRWITPSPPDSLSFFAQHWGCLGKDGGETGLGQEHRLTSYLIYSFILEKNNPRWKASCRYLCFCLLCCSTQLTQFIYLFIFFLTKDQNEFKCCNDLETFEETQGQHNIWFLPGSATETVTYVSKRQLLTPVLGTAFRQRTVLSERRSSSFHSC